MTKQEFLDTIVASFQNRLPQGMTHIAGNTRYASRLFLARRNHKGVAGVTKQAHQAEQLEKVGSIAIFGDELFFSAPCGGHLEYRDWRTHLADPDGFDDAITEFVLRLSGTYHESNHNSSKVRPQSSRRPKAKV